jgi:uncharacterized protein YqfA (UPF0365 family)
VNGNPVILAVALAMVLVFLVFLLMFLPVIRLWVQALRNGTQVGIGDIIALRLRRVPPELIVHAAIALRQHGHRVPAREIADCYLKHGAPPDMNATQLATLVAAERADRAGTPQA